MTATSEALLDAIERLGPWFHNLRLGAAGEVQTAPNHPLGDFPSNFWQVFKHVVPEDLTGKRVLDIGCNAGFYSVEMKRRGGAHVYGVDHDVDYLAQAAFARDQLGLADVELGQLEVYDLDRLRGETFDLVLFLGVFYHLRHPLLALEKVASLVAPGGRLLFQTMERGSPELADLADDYPIDEQDVFTQAGFPRMSFVEKSYAGDPTNWWIPNAAASAAMLRSVGLRILERPCSEVYLCEPDPASGRSPGAVGRDRARVYDPGRDRASPP